MSKSKMVKIEGARELRKAIRKAQREDLRDALKKANRDGAEIAAKEARTLVPERSGALGRTIRALGSQTRGQVAAGRGRVNRYAGIIHFGNPKRGIKPQPFLYDAVDNKVREIRRAYSKKIDALAKDLSTRK